jgi:hypothetical protein
MNSLNCILILTVILLLFSVSKAELFAQPDGQSEKSEQKIKPAGYASAPYMDNYKYMVIKESQEPMTLFQAVNTFHTDDILYIQCRGNSCPAYELPYGKNYLFDNGVPRQVDNPGDDKWVPVANIISVMEVDAFAVIVLDRAVNISSRRLGVAPSEKSAASWKTTIFPDPLKTPVTEIMSMSRWQVY